jgi:hypothetical protein
MNSRLPVLASIAACVVLFGSIAFVFALLAYSLINGGVPVSGEPHAAAAVWRLVV